MDKIRTFYPSSPDESGSPPEPPQIRPSDTPMVTNEPNTPDMQMLEKLLPLADAFNALYQLTLQSPTPKRSENFATGETIRAGLAGSSKETLVESEKDSFY